MKTRAIVFQKENLKRCSREKKMARLLEQLEKNTQLDKVIYRHDLMQEEELTAKQVWEYSDKLAFYLNETYKEDKSPIVVYGHKHPFMLVYFLACVKSGRAFCPVDVNTPIDRVRDIAATVKSPIVLVSEAIELDTPIMTVDEAKKIITKTKERVSKEHYVKDEDIFYIIFTSGSTGKPKGVSITYANLNHFLDWYTAYYDGKGPQVFLGHPPFSFDLSVMSLWPALYMHIPLIQIDKQHLQDFKVLFKTLEESKATVWISTPSFAEMCLADPSFNEDLLPELEQFVFCGEKLFSSTVEKLMERFPKAEVVNTYGPTESTVMVTWMPLTKELVERYPDNLPVGVVKPGTTVLIDGENSGEIIIYGNTVAKGYYENPEMNQKHFFEVDGERAYRTGDVGHFEGELLFCEGRIDFQIKLHGHRIELEDIDNNLLKNPKIRQAATVPSFADGKVKSITSFVVYNEPIEKRFETVKLVKKELAQHVPEYMIPKKVVFLDEMPLNNNGKIDKKQLKELV